MIEVFVACDRDQLVEPVGLLGRYPSSQIGEPKVLPPGIGGPFRILGRLFDQTVLRQASQGLVQAASRGFEPTAGTLFDVLPNGIPVRRSLPKRQQDVERKIAQWQVVLWFYLLRRHIGGSVALVDEIQL